MLYHWLFPLADRFTALNVFRYITFRSAGAIVTAVVLSLILGPWFIRRLQRPVDRAEHSRRRSGASPIEGGYADHGRSSDPVSR